MIKRGWPEPWINTDISALLDEHVRLRIPRYPGGRIREIIKDLHPTAGRPDVSQDAGSASVTLAGDG